MMMMMIMDGWMDGATGWFTAAGHPRAAC